MNPLNSNEIDGNTLNIGLYERTRNGMQRIVEEKLTMLKYNSFEDYLSQIFAEGDGATCLDDNFPDAFSDWLCDQDIDDVIKWADKYAAIKKGETK